MAKNLSFNFNTLPKKYFNTTLKDGTTLLLEMPKLKTFKKIGELQKMQADEDQDVEYVMSVLADVMAECLSTNKQGIKVNADQVAEDYDVAEITAFIADYYEKFVGSIQNNPN